MKKIWLFAAAAGALSLAACDPNHAGMRRGFGPKAPLKPLEKLNCPDTEGSLKRVSASADGQSCDYADTDGTTVSLRRVATTDGEAALKPVEASLRALVPDLSIPAKQQMAGAADASQESRLAAAKAEASAKADTAEAAAAKAEAAADRAQDAADRAQDKAGVSVMDDGDGKGLNVDVHSDENVNVNFPGFHMNTNGDNAKISILGMKIDADDANDRVRISRSPKSGVGRSFSVDAHDGGAIIKMDSGNSVNIKRMLILASDKPGAQGDEMVGYVAHGPRKGPLIVATVRSKDKEDGHDTEGKDLMRDVTKLVKKNAGG